MRTLANGNFQENDVRRICRYCNKETPNINQYDSHRKSAKHIKVYYIE